MENHSLRSLPTREVKGAGPKGGRDEDGVRISFQLKPEMKANQGEEGQEGYGARNEGERGMHIQGGFLEEGGGKRRRKRL